MEEGGGGGEEKGCRGNSSSLCMVNFCSTFTSHVKNFSDHDSSLTSEPAPEHKGPESKGRPFRSVRNA